MNRLKVMLKDIADTYELFALQVTNEDIVPGTVMNCEWHRVISSRRWPEFTRVEGDAWVLEPSVGQNDNSTKRGRANLFRADISRKMEIGGDVSLSDLGLTATTSASFSKTIRYTVGSVDVCHFAQQGRAIQIVQSLQKSKIYERWLAKDFLVSEAYYTDDIRIDIKSSGSVSAKAEWTAAGIQPANPKIKLTWETDSSFVMQGTSNTPFAVRGYRL